MRVHFLENVGKALDQMRSMNIHAENIGPIDIVDGNAHLILGLIWTFILNFQVLTPFVSLEKFIANFFFWLNWLNWKSF